MRQAPIVHFSGRFQFHMPEYNNDPGNLPVAFDPARPPDQVKALCGCDPAHYYEFRFLDVRVEQVTYQDGSTVTAGDPVVGQPIQLAGFLADVSPSAICAQLFAARLDLGDALRGAVRKGIQSDLRLNMRPLGFTDETAAAHFDTTIAVERLQTVPGSRFFTELGHPIELELHFHVNHYIRLDNLQAPEAARLTGDVYGYIRPGSPAEAAGATRTRCRRLVAHSHLSQRREIEHVFLTTIGPKPTPVMRITDIDGSYDLLEEDSLLALRYLDFVPFLDRDYATPTSAGIVDSYVVYLDSDAGPTTEVGRFTGDHAEMRRTGGLLVFSLPRRMAGLADVRLAVDVVKDGAFRHPLMAETEWDLVLLSDRGVTLGSGEKATAVARVYQRNRPATNRTVTLRTQPQNRRSPIVASFVDSELTTDQNGEMHAVIHALDLMNAGRVYDPITLLNYDRLPSDRYYGNYVYLAIPNPLRRTNPALEEIEISVRVLHKIDPAHIPAQPSFKRDVQPLFAYQVRYLPWLHVRHTGQGYERFLDLDDYNSFSDNAQEIIRRLELDEQAREKMPRSRDFPVGGVEVISRWYASGMLE